LKLVESFRIKTKKVDMFSVETPGWTVSPLEREADGVIDVLQLMTTEHVTLSIMGPARLTFALPAL
jgi:hypothetical protein